MVGSIALFLTNANHRARNLNQQLWENFLRDAHNLVDKIYFLTPDLLAADLGLAANLTITMDSVSQLAETMYDTAFVQDKFTLDEVFDEETAALVDDSLNLTALIAHSGLKINLSNCTSSDAYNKICADWSTIEESELLPARLALQTESARKLQCAENLYSIQQRFAQFEEYHNRLSSSPLRHAHFQPLFRSSTPVSPQREKEILALLKPHHELFGTLVHSMSAFLGAPESENSKNRLRSLHGHKVRTSRDLQKMAVEDDKDLVQALRDMGSRCAKRLDFQAKLEAIELMESSLRAHERA